jgi:hypothetical protein
MRKTTPLKEIYLAQQEEETTQMEKEEGMKEKSKVKVKLHRRNIPYCNTIEEKGFSKETFRKKEYMH